METARYYILYGHLVNFDNTKLKMIHVKCMIYMYPSRNIILNEKKVKDYRRIFY